MDMGIVNAIVPTKFARQMSIFGWRRIIKLMSNDNSITSSEEDTKIIHKLVHNEHLTIVKVCRT